MKTFLLLILIVILGIFIYLKVQVASGENSKFNQTTRYGLGKHPFWRSVLGLHNAGDARAEFLENKGDVAIEWFKPVSLDFDESVLEKFSQAVGRYTGRNVNLGYGGGIDDGTIPLDNLKSFALKASAQRPKGDTLLLVFITNDYLPRVSDELSATYGESAVVLSLTAHKTFLGNFQKSLNDYLFTSLLHEFGHEIGLDHNSDTKCIMSEHAGINGSPLEFYGENPPLDFCAGEQQSIEALKLQYE